MGKNTNHQLASLDFSYQVVCHELLSAQGIETLDFRVA